MGLVRFGRFPNPISLKRYQIQMWLIGFGWLQEPFFFLKMFESQMGLVRFERA